MVVDWCPKCSAQLPPGLEECPRCGKKLGKKNEEENPKALNREDIFNITLTVMAYAAIPLVIILIVALICVFSAR